MPCVTRLASPREEGDKPVVRNCLLLYLGQEPLAVSRPLASFVSSLGDEGERQEARRQLVPSSRTARMPLSHTQ
jgi:hypothetical protein